LPQEFESRPVNYGRDLHGCPVRGVDGEIEADIAEQLREIGVEEGGAHKISSIWLHRQFVAVLLSRVVEESEVLSEVQWT
jgi:hypothetical protein